MEKIVFWASIVQIPEPAACHRSLLSSQAAKGLLSSTAPLWWKCMYCIYAALLSNRRKIREASKRKMMAVCGTIRILDAKIVLFGIRLRFKNGRLDLQYFLCL